MAINRIILSVSFSFLIVFSFSQNLSTSKQVTLQGFWWDYFNSNYSYRHADYLADLAPRLRAIGIDAVWIPPSIKNKQIVDMGYAPFDHYDLGDKYQKGYLKTKLGDKDQLLRMVAVMKANGIDVIQDIVLNHITGAGSQNGSGGQDPQAIDDGSSNKYKNFRYSCFETPSTLETSSNYLSRKGRFSKNWQNFYPNNNYICCSNEINSPYWGPDISYEANSYGLSSNAIYNPNQSSGYMRSEMRNWLLWYKKQVGFSGVRIDAIKHFPTYVVEDFLWNLQNGNGWANTSEDMFAVGEWVGNSTELDQWCSDVQNRAGTFDFSLRNAFTGIVQGLGAFDLGSVPNYQQGNRFRTVPFVNNHDTFRPILDADGNYINWNTSQQLGAQIEPNDPRLSLVYAISFALDGAPMVYFEDLFNIGYNGNRYNHNPKDSLDLPMRSDIVNIIWCHQNLNFKDGSYLVRWQENDALVVERDAKAIIAVNDSWDNWKTLTGVQTNWLDGTVLKDYSGAHLSTITVYGGGKIDFTIPSCDGTAPNGRKGYAIWGPDGITSNYSNPSESITQEWEMADDLGDSHLASLQQGGKLPTNSLECRVVGKVHANSQSTLSVELYPLFSNLSIDILLLDRNCDIVDSVSGIGILNHDFLISNEDIYTLKIRNTTDSQLGQKCWVKVTYQAPEVPDLTIQKNVCGCSTISNLEFKNFENYVVYPNPVSKFIYLKNQEKFISKKYIIFNNQGLVIKNGNLKNGSIYIGDLDNGIYVLQYGNETKKFIKN
ncbi:alpha-amylase family glycosyl hydrolase [Flavobacteriales bacterium]|nr:alpha-amylase family glycosyl hydrolase [Flavobacteriales bacterium]